MFRKLLAAVLAAFAWAAIAATPAPAASAASASAVTPTSQRLTLKKCDHDNSPVDPGLASRIRASGAEHYRATVDPGTVVKMTYAKKVGGIGEYTCETSKSRTAMAYKNESGVWVWIDEGCGNTLLEVKAKLDWALVPAAAQASLVSTPAPAAQPSAAASAPFRAASGAVITTPRCIECELRAACELAMGPEAKLVGFRVVEGKLHCDGPKPMDIEINRYLANVRVNTYGGKVDVGSVPKDVDVPEAQQRIRVGGTVQQIDLGGSRTQVKAPMCRCRMTGAWIAAGSATCAPTPPPAKVGDEMVGAFVAWHCTATSFASGGCATERVAANAACVKRFGKPNVEAVLHADGNFTCAHPGAYPNQQK